MIHLLCSAVFLSDIYYVKHTCPFWMVANIFNIIFAMFFDFLLTEYKSFNQSLFQIKVLKFILYLICASVFLSHALDIYYVKYTCLFCILLNILILFCKVFVFFYSLNRKLSIKSNFKRNFTKLLHIQFADHLFSLTYIMPNRLTFSRHWEKNFMLFLQIFSLFFIH